MELRLGLVSPIADVGELSGDRRRCSHGWRNQVGSSTLSLPTFEVAVRRRSASFAWLQSIRVHRQTHAASRFTPVETSLLEDAVQPFRFRLSLHLTTARNDHRINLVADAISFDDVRCRAEVFDSSVGTGADEDAIDRDVGQGHSRLESHVVQCVRCRFAFCFVGEGSWIWHFRVDRCDLTRVGPQVTCGSMSEPL